MTQKKLNEIKATLEFLKNGRDATAKMSDEDCRAVYGIPKATALQNMDAAIAKHEAELESEGQLLMGIDRKLYEAASKNIHAVAGRGDLEPHMRDDHDFFEVSIWELEAALKDAYEAGKASK